DALEALAGGRAVADEPGVERGRTEMPIAPEELHQELRRRGRARAEVEREIAQHERPARAMEERHLVLVGSPAEEDLIDLASPGFGCLVREDRFEHQVGTLPL